MKTTEYFKFRQALSDRAPIKETWIRGVIANPLATETQSDGRIRMWGRIEEAGGRYLRVILLEDRETIHNAFFDRSFKVTRT